MTNVQYIPTICAALVTVVVDLGPGAFLLTQLWELKQVCFQVISTDQVFLPPQGNNLSLCPPNPGRRVTAVLNLASELNSQLG